MKTTTFLRSVLVMLLAASMLVSMIACDKTPAEPTPGTDAPETNAPETDAPEVEAPYVWVDDGKTYTYNYYLSQSPSNWNELTYQDNNDTEIMSYIGSNFYSYDFKYDEYGQILPGEFVMKYAAATKLEDVTAEYVGEGSGLAYKITLREDLKWEDGTPIKAEDFVYTMQQQLDPLFQNYRADSFYLGATIIKNAQAYAKQGQSGWFAADAPYATYSEDLDDKIIFTLAPASDEIAAEASVRGSMGFPASYDAAATAAYFINNYLGECAFTAEAAAAMEGKTMAEIKADETLKAAWEALIGWWQTEPDEELDFFVTNYTYPEIAWEEVGIFVGDTEYEIVLVLEKSLQLLKEDGSLSYKAAYNMSSLPLVHKATYEACKKAPSEGTTLWTTNYNSSVDTTMSWGPYKLESFQAGKQYVLVRNENWYGYADKENEGLYMTDRIQVEIIQEWNAAWLRFLAGELDGIGIDVTVADDYKGSDRAYFTPDDFVGSLQLQSSKEGLKARETEGINKTLLSYVDFRKALSLSIDRADFANKTTTSSLAGFGLFNSMHYYDVENGGVFRNSDEAKKVLCDIYAVDYTKYETLDDAVDAITGYNVEEARALLTKAYNEALAAGDIKETDKVLLTFGSGTINEVVQRRCDFIANAWKELAVGTPLEGRIEVELKDFATAWSNDFRAGAYDVCMGGWTGAAWDPGYFLLAYLSPSYMYSKAWDTANQQLTFTMVGVAEDGGDITETMSLLEWYDCLNGAAGAKYDWSETALPNAQRLQLIAALEKEVLAVYYTVPLYNNFGASLLSYQVDYVTYEYNTFLGYGGVKYMTYNFDDAEWAAEVAAQNGELNYK
ncbi:MAG: hypothetical protein IKV39_02025 [Clostridia bacterium]|nr:hypothetical protein [Clostridia bacterium]